MLKFHDFSLTQILREINFWDSRSTKSAILTHLEALYFDFNEFWHILKAEICLINKIQTSKSLKWQKMALSQLLDSPKLISRKI